MLRRACVACGCAGLRLRLRAGQQRHGLSLGSPLKIAPHPPPAPPSSSSARCLSSTTHHHQEQHAPTAAQGRPDSLSHSHSQCWACGNRMACCNMFCGCGHIVPVEHHCDYFQLLGMPHEFALDMQQMERNFFELQKKLHPDKNSDKPQEERQASLKNSAMINAAYQILTCPTQRASYLLSMHGVNILEEGRTFTDTQLLMEIMELREFVDTASSESELQDFLERTLQPKIEATLSAIQSEWSSHRLDKMALAAVCLKYYTKVRDEVKDKLHKLDLSSS